MQQSRAIVLNKINYSETSLILKIYTEQEGLLSFIVKGIRGKKGKLRMAQFQALNLLEIDYKQTGKSDLRFILDLKISEPFSDLLFDPIKRAVALFLAELIQNCIKEEEQNTELFFFFTSIYTLARPKQRFVYTFSPSIYDEINEVSRVLSYEKHRKCPVF